MSSTKSGRKLQHIVGNVFKQAFQAADGAEAQHGKPFENHGLIRPNIDNRVFNVSHYGVMIPDLPEPFRFFSLMAIIGTAGNRFIDTDHMLVDEPARNATQVSGTAAEGTGQFASYSIDRDCDIHTDGSLIRLGSDVTLSGTYPEVRLQISREGFELDITLHCHDNVTWFAHTPVYKHLGLMADYKGYLEYKGERLDISGPCTYEYFTMASLHGFIRKPLPRWLRVPTDFFTYQIVHIDGDTQLMLAKVGALGEALLEAAFIRSRGEASYTLSKSTHFEVRRFEDKQAVTPDGRTMRLPKEFTWTVRDNERTVAIIHGTVDTPFIYGLCSGYVGGYRYEGEFKGKKVCGRAYIEYVDAAEPLHNRSAGELKSTASANG